MKFTYTKFGTLKEVQISKPYWHIVNEEGKKVSINYHQYARSQRFLDKLNELVGHPVVYRTTRRDEAIGQTGEWPSDHWFSDVFLDDGLSHNWPKEGDKETVQTIVELRLELKRAAKRAEREVKEAEEQREFDRKQTTEMLAFEAVIESMRYDDYMGKMSSDDFFRERYGAFVTWRSERLRTNEEQNKYPEEKEKWERENLTTLKDKGYHWSYCGRIGTWEVDPEGNLKVWVEDYSDWYHFAFPQHVFYRTLQQSKLPTLQKHIVWALIKDDHEDEMLTTFADMTVRNWADDPEDNEWEPYKTLHETELLPHLIDKINDNANQMESNAEAYGEAMFKLELAKPSDEELLYFYQTEIRPHERRAMGLEAALAPRLEQDPEFAKKYRFYQELRKETDEAGKTFFTDVTLIEDFESYKWIELPAPFNVSERAKNPYAPNTFANTPTAPLQVYYEVGDIRVWTFDGGPPLKQPKDSQKFSMTHDFRGEAMRRKLVQQLDKMPIYLLVNEKTMTFLDVTLANGDLDRLELMQAYGEEEHWTRLQRKIERFAIDKSEQADSFQNAYLEARDEINQLSMKDQQLLAYNIEQVNEHFDYMESVDNFPVMIIGMALKADNARANATIWPTHADASLAVRTGINTSKRSKLILDVFDRHYKNGEPFRNMVECTIEGKDVTVGLGRSTDEGTRGKWMITTCFAASRRHEAALKKLGYSNDSRDMRNKPLQHFLDLYKEAAAMVVNPKHPSWGKK